jgi:hypothetical protein
MSRASVLARGRAAALIGMTDACTVRRSTGETEGPGGVIETTWSTVYDGQCRVQVSGRVQPGSPADVGEAALMLTQHEVQLPIAAVGILEGDRIEVTASAHDPDLVGRLYAVRAILTKSEATSRRVAAIEVTS